MLNTEVQARTLALKATRILTPESYNAILKYEELVSCNIPEGSDKKIDNALTIAFNRIIGIFDTIQERKSLNATEDKNEVASAFEDLRMTIKEEQESNKKKYLHLINSSQ